VVRIRRDAMHKCTTRLARTCGISVVGTLHVSGMLRHRRLARAVADAGMAELRRQLAYTTVWYGLRLAPADTFYPSSNTCSCCGAVKESLPLWKRVFRVTPAGLSLTGTGTWHGTWRAWWPPSPGVDRRVCREKLCVTRR
jgi:putative transposase